MFANVLLEPVDINVLPLATLEPLQRQLLQPKKKRNMFLK